MGPYPDPRDAYLDYRRLKSADSGRLSPKMIASINALESRLGTRGRPQPEMVKMANSRNLVKNVMLQKQAQTFENRTKATSALRSFLESRGNIKNNSAPVTPAAALKDELELLADFLLAATGGVKWIPGPPKKLEKAMGKTIEDYGYAWGLNKDLVRGTLACDNTQTLGMVAASVRQTCTNEFGMFLMKTDEQKSVRDGGDSKAGYSGWNFVVQFKEHRLFGAEVQANTFDLMYGKMSKKDFCEILKVEETAYRLIENRLGFRGGLGHALYDIQDVGRSHATIEEGNLARALSLDYNDACRGEFRQTTLQDLNRRIQEFGTHLTSSEAKKLWQHALG
jgi:hypothetical protein